jgi:hypothetical protein
MFTILLLFAHVTKGTSILKYANGWNQLPLI